MGELTNVCIPDPHVHQTVGLQIGDHRFSASCGVVERPDHHCGDDLVDLARLFRLIVRKPVQFETPCNCRNLWVGLFKMAQRFQFATQRNEIATICVD